MVVQLESLPVNKTFVLNPKCPNDSSTRDKGDVVYLHELMCKLEGGRLKTNVLARRVGEDEAKVNVNNVALSVQ